MISCCGVDSMLDVINDAKNEESLDQYLNLRLEY